MTHGSLFSGIGGFDLAAEWMGWDNLFHCEINEWCAKVLKYHFPNSKHYADITQTDFTEWRGRIDVLTGGFPCQPFSYSGQRKGADDDRYLWPEMLRVIREVRPTWIVGENVDGISTMVQPGSEIEVEHQATLFEKDHKETILEQEFVIETVCSSLEREGYSVQPILIPACSLGAPHRRDRVWFIAHSNSNGDIPRKENTGTESSWRGDYGKPEEWGKQTERITGSHSILRPSSDAQCFGGDEIHKEVQPEQPDGDSINSNGSQRIITDTCSCRFSNRPQECNPQDQSKDGARKGNRITRSGDVKPSSFTGSDSYWEAFPTQSPICSGNDGVSTRLDGITFSKWRTESVKGYGNAIVPQVALEIFRAIELVTKRFKSH